jgi:hypothetical protein
LKRAGLNHLHRLLHRTESRDDDHQGLRTPRPHRVQQFIAGQTWHAHIRDEQIYPFAPALDVRHRSAPVNGHDGFVSRVFQVVLQQIAQIRVVFRNQYSRAHAASSFLTSVALASIGPT